MSWTGPLWLGKIFNKQFCELMDEENKHVAFRNNRKIRKILSLAIAEVDEPETYFVIDKISDKLSLPVPSVSSTIQKLRDKGFSAVPTLFNSRGIRTNAPATIMQNLLRESAAKTNPNILFKK
jgi:tRNA (guanine26-N2/guanine27-N2)-dimethyltransferase